MSTPFQPATQKDDLAMTKNPNPMSPSDAHPTMGRPNRALSRLKHHANHVVVTAVGVVALLVFCAWADRPTAPALAREAVMIMVVPLTLLNGIGNSPFALAAISVFLTLGIMLMLDTKRLAVQLVLIPLSSLLILFAVHIIGGLGGVAAEAVIDRMRPQEAMCDITGGACKAILPLPVDGTIVEFPVHSTRPLAPLGQTRPTVTGRSMYDAMRETRSDATPARTPANTPTLGHVVSLTQTGPSTWTVRAQLDAELTPEQGLTLAGLNVTLPLR